MAMQEISREKLLGQLNLDKRIKQTQNTKVKKHFKERRTMEIQQIKNKMFESALDVIQLII